jgi:hypothetical protein
VKLHSSALKLDGGGVNGSGEEKNLLLVFGFFNT